MMATLISTGSGIAHLRQLIFHHGFYRQVRAMATTANQKTAAGLIIGTEILTGKVADVNTAVLARFLYSAGIRLDRVEVVRDIEDDIAKSCQSLAKSHDYVFTSGGVGSTHDDITYESVAKAFGRSVAVDSATQRAMERHFGVTLDSVAQRMVKFPTGCEVLRVANHCVPIVRLENVYMLPGVPILFERLLLAQRDRFQTEQVMANQKLRTLRSETDIAAALLKASQKYEGVEVGSYPHFGLLDKENYVLVTCEGLDHVSVAECAAYIKAAIGASDVL